MYLDFLNTAKGFWDVYQTRPGHVRRRSLLRLFLQNPGAKLPVNNKWQANTCDPDLTRLLKKGVLTQVRDRGSRRHPMNRSSSKRQSYLVLSQPTGGVAIV